MVLQVLRLQLQASQLLIDSGEITLDWSDSVSTYTVHMHIKNGETTNSISVQITLTFFDDQIFSKDSQSLIFPVL